MRRRAGPSPPRCDGYPHSLIDLLLAAECVPGKRYPTRQSGSAKKEVQGFACTSLKTTVNTYLNWNCAGATKKAPELYVNVISAQVPFGVPDGVFQLYW